MYKYMKRRRYPPIFRRRECLSRVPPTLSQRRECIRGRLRVHGSAIPGSVRHPPRGYFEGNIQRDVTFATFRRSVNSAVYIKLDVEGPFYVARVPLVSVLDRFDHGRDPPLLRGVSTSVTPNSEVLNRPLVSLYRDADRGSACSASLLRERRLIVDITWICASIEGISYI